MVPAEHASQVTRRDAFDIAPVPMPEVEAKLGRHDQWIKKLLAKLAVTNPRRTFGVVLQRQNVDKNGFISIKLNIVCRVIG